MSTDISFPTDRHTEVVVNEQVTEISVRRPAVVELRTAIAGPRGLQGEQGEQGEQGVQGDFIGALVTKAANQTMANLTTPVAITWNTETYDEGGFHEGVTNPSRLTVPSGVTKIRVASSVCLQSVSLNVYIMLTIYKNGSAVYSGVPQQSSQVGVGSTQIGVASGAIPVVEGDYFETFIEVQTDTSVTIVAGRSWMSIEACNGVKGDTGDTGAAGSDDLHYMHDQMSASAVWVITHNLGKYPSVVVVDSGGAVCEGSPVYDSINQVTVTFSAAFAGLAYLN